MALMARIDSGIAISARPCDAPRARSSMTQLPPCRGGGSRRAHVGQCPAAEQGAVVGREVSPWVGVLVDHLHQQPELVPPRPEPGQRPVTLQLLSVEPEDSMS